MDTLGKTVEGLQSLDERLRRMTRGPARDQLKAARIELLERLADTPATVLAPSRRHRARQPDHQPPANVVRCPEVPAPCARCSELERDRAAALEQLAAANDRCDATVHRLAEAEVQAQAAADKSTSAEDRATRLAGALLELVGELREASSRAMVTHAEAFPNASGGRTCQ